jgi:hypothetical protein
VKAKARSGDEPEKRKVEAASGRPRAHRKEAAENDPDGKTTMIVLPSVKIRRQIVVIEENERARRKKRNEKRKASEHPKIRQAIIVQTTTRPDVVPFLERKSK